MTSNVQTIRPEQLPQALEKVLTQYDQLNQTAANKVLQEAGYNMFGSVIEETPVGVGPDKGVLKGGWRVSSHKRGYASLRRQPNRTRVSITSQIRTKVNLLKRPVYLVNAVPYVNVVEYGGYTKNPRLGTWNPDTRRYEIRSRGGFSKQAPKGMVRRNVNKFNRFIEIAANKIL